MTDEQERRLAKLAMAYFIAVSLQVIIAVGIWGTALTHRMDSMKAELKAEWRKP